MADHYDNYAENVTVEGYYDGVAALGSVDIEDYFALVWKCRTKTC